MEESRCEIFGSGQVALIHPDSSLAQEPGLRVEQRQRLLEALLQLLLSIYILLCSLRSRAILSYPEESRDCRDTVQISVFK